MVAMAEMRTLAPFARDADARRDARRAEAPCRWQGARAASAKAQAAADPGGAASATEGGADGDARWGADVAARRPLGPPGGPMRHPPRRPPGDGPAAGGGARACADRPPSAHCGQSRRTLSPGAMRAARKGDLPVAGRAPHRRRREPQPIQAAQPARQKVAASARAALKAAPAGGRPKAQPATLAAGRWPGGWARREGPLRPPTALRAL
ncbi:MAG: hypothetical protein CO163_02075 [Rhodobacterales bacterium CG_4_9_14_3_um_filter_71_31]|nr:MAG: hypothetical protein CO163_02075 [Rhodobacterales bacterium CG_4_9_14_3_um_filter_71_31]